MPKQNEPDPVKRLVDMAPTAKELGKLSEKIRQKKQAPQRTEAD